MMTDWPSYEVDEIEAVAEVLRSGKVNYWTGEEGRCFETEFAEYCASRYAIALANGTVALELALEALGIGEGSDVIVTPRSFVASASCVVRVGAKPVFADVSRDSQNITPDTVASACTESTRAIIAVHHAGWPCDMDGLMRIAEDRGIFVIEDCAQAHGAMYAGRPVGSMGHAGAFSFCQDKIITTGGEGGMLVLNDELVWRKAWSIKDHGKSYAAVYEKEHPIGFRWLHESIGTNWRMTEMQAAIGRLQLQKLASWSARRRTIAGQLTAALAAHSCVRVPGVPVGMTHACYRLYAFVEPNRLDVGWDRDRILAEFDRRGVPGLSGSCSEIYREKAFTDIGLEPPKQLPVARELAYTSIAFLVHPTLTDQDVAETCAVIDEVLSEASA